MLLPPVWAINIRRGSGQCGLLDSSKAGLAHPPKESNLILPGWLSHLPLLLPQLPVNFNQNSLPGVRPSFLSLRCKAHSPLPLVNNGARGKISGISYPCGVDGTLSALILSSGMSITIHEAPPFFPHGCVWYTWAFSGQKEEKNPVSWLNGPKQPLGNHSHLQKKPEVKF